MRLIIWDRSVPIRILDYILWGEYLQEIIDSLYAVNAYPNFMLRIMGWIFIRNN